MLTSHGINTPLDLHFVWITAARTTFELSRERLSVGSKVDGVGGAVLGPVGGAVFAALFSSKGSSGGGASEGG